MANSKTQLLNLALSQISENVVVDIDDTSLDAARKGKLHFEPTLKEILRSHPWNFAKDREILSQNTLFTGTDDEWGFSYTLPTQLVRLIKLNGILIGRDTTSIAGLFEIEGRNILTNCDTAKISFVYYTEDVTIFDPLFDAAFVDLYSSKLAAIIPGDTELSERLRDKYDNVTLPKAKKVDANEKNPRRYSTINNSTWLRSRFIQPASLNT